MSDTTYRLELARPGLWVLWSDGDCIGNNDRWDEEDVEEVQEWASNVVHLTHGVWIERWSGESPLFTATSDASVVDDRAERRRRHLSGEGYDDGGLPARDDRDRWPRW
jgi:hypothetical protein